MQFFLLELTRMYSFYAHVLQNTEENCSLRCESVYWGIGLPLVWRDELPSASTSKTKLSETLGLQIIFVLSSRNVCILFHWPGCLFNPEECGSSLMRKLVNFCQTARRHILESSDVHNLCHEKILNLIGFCIPLNLWNVMNTAADTRS